MKLKEALLYCGDMKQLRDISRKAGGDNESDIGKAAEKAAGYLLQPSIMKERMRVLHDDDIIFFRNAAAHGPLVPAIMNYDSADRLRSLGYGFVTGREMMFEIPDDVFFVFQTIDTAGYSAEREKYSWTYDCLRLVPYLYGIISRYDFSILFHQNRQMRSIDYNEIYRMTDSLLSHNPCPVHASKDELIRNGLEESGMLERLRQIHSGVSPSFPSYHEMKTLLENRYAADDAAWKKLYSYLMRCYKSRERTLYVLETVWAYITSGATYAQVNEAVQQDDSEFTDNDEWKQILAMCWQTTRMMLCNGYRPAEIGLDVRQIFLH